MGAGFAIPREEKAIELKSCCRGDATRFIPLRDFNSVGDVADGLFKI